MDLKSVGIWTGQLDYQPASRVREAVAELEELGYGAVWIGEAAGREALSNAGLLLGVTRRLVVATGIANIWVRDALAMVAGQYTLAEAYPERFLLGLGVSHAPLIEEMRGHHYQRPLAAMRQYLNAMDEVVGAYRAIPPATPRRGCWLPSAPRCSPSPPNELRAFTPTSCLQNTPRRPVTCSVTGHG